MTVTCTVCGGGDVARVVEVPRVPVLCNRLCATPEEARQAPTADVSLGYCRGCGHLYNVDFDPSRVEYAPGYENSLGGSERFRRYADALAEDLVHRYDLRRKVVVEIGCGRADFLRSLCARGGSRGWGFDPSHPEEPDRGDAFVTVVPELYGPDHAHVPADLVCCRHCLEHVQHPVGLLRAVAEALSSRPATPVFFEVPNAVYVLRDGGIWDLIYEHCGYFSAGSLARAFEEAGLAVTEVAEAFGGQFLTLHARSGGPVVPRREIDPADLGAHVEGFADRYRSKVASWRERLSRLARERRRVAVWGAGSKGTTFLNVLDPDAELVGPVVDVNPRKQGCFVPGTGHPIVAPESLVADPPDAIVVMNPNYVDEIARATRRLGLEVERMVG